MGTRTRSSWGNFWHSCNHRWKGSYLVDSIAVSVFVVILVEFDKYYQKQTQISLTRSLGALRAPTSSWGPFGPLDFVLRALRALRPCDPRSFSQEGRHEGELPKNTGLLSLPSHDDYHECWVNKYRSFVDPAFVIIIMGREREQNRIFCDRGGQTEEE